MDELLIAAVGIAAVTFLVLFLWERQTSKWLARLVAMGNARDDGHDPEDLPYGASGGGYLVCELREAKRQADQARPAGTPERPDEDQDGDRQ